MNYYARAIEIIADDKTDWRAIVVKIAQNHPKVLVDAAGPVWREEARSMWISGNKVDAIKLCRDKTGKGLFEAKEYVEGLV